MHLNVSNTAGSALLTEGPKLFNEVLLYTLESMLLSYRMWQ